MNARQDLPPQQERWSAVQPTRVCGSPPFLGGLNEWKWIPCSFSLDVPLAPGPLDTGLVPGVNSHKGESKPFVSVFSGKHTILMALCTEPLFARISMPFSSMVTAVTH